MKSGPPRHVIAPDGSGWSVGRLWFGGRRMKSWERRSELGSRLTDGGSSVFDIFDGGDVEAALIGIAVILAIVFIVVPLLLFGIELILLGFILAIGLVGRSLFGKPWTVAATRTGEETPVALWRVKGWRASNELIDHICIDLEVRGLLASDFPQAAYVERVDDPLVS